MAEISIINANELTTITEPDNGKSILMVNNETNEGYVINWDDLVNAVLRKVYSDEMTDTSFKLFVVD